MPDVPKEDTDHGESQRPHRLVRIMVSMSIYCNLVFDFDFGQHDGAGLENADFLRVYKCTKVFDRVV